MITYPGKHSERFFGKPFIADQLFCNLSTKTQQALSNAKRTVWFKPGKTICGIGECPKNIYILRKGAAALYIAPGESQNRLIRKIAKNEVLGLAESLACFRYEAGAVAETDCICEQINSHDLTDILAIDPELSFHILSALGANLQQSYKSFAALGFRVTSLAP